jgi:benzodiazapine receptor
MLALQSTGGEMVALRSVIGLVVSIGTCFVAAAVGSAFTTAAIPEWYATLSKPTWTPPNWLFAPVWSLLYLSMGVSAWLVWRRAGLAAAAVPLALFVLQLVLNALWSVLFFGLHSPGSAFAEIVLLWAAILATLVAFWRCVPVAGILIAPYLLWVSFAAALNFSIWRMNR